MNLHDLLPLLRGVKGPSGSGEYTARCPSHDDKQASLCIRSGNKGIVLKCQAGCSCDAVCHALGIEVRDLFFEQGSRNGSPASSSRMRNPPQMKVNTPKEYASYDAAYGHLGTVEIVYPYTDAKGTLLFEVARIRQANGGKTFRQHRPAHPEKGTFPIICNVPAEVRNTTLYRLPEVAAAIRAGKPVYIVEGEKDADTLTKMGYCGTTNPGGAGKWTTAQSALLTGADVIVVPDEDPESNGQAGQAHGRDVINKTISHARRIRLVRLKDGYPELPDKGDISDLASLVGLDGAKAILDSLASKAITAVKNLYQRALTAYANVPGFCVDNGCICSVTQDGSKRTMGTFVALPVREILRDDGVQSSIWLEIAGWDSCGRSLPTQQVPMSKFASMEWVSTGWGMKANIMSGNGVKDRLRSVITMAGASVTDTEMMYTHYGWRRIDGKWCYLYQGGCIGTEGVTVDLGDGLHAYSLDNYPEDMEPQAAAISSMRLVSVIRERVSIPLLGLTYLAPLREFLQQSGCDPAFAVFLYGRTGSRKSTAAALFLSHFGEFTSRSLPASFNDTSNYIRTKAFALKDAVLVVDDYHPTSSVQERRQMERTAQSLARAFGDNAERGRLGADLSIQASRPPRSMAIISGEDVPDIGESGVSRYYVINVEGDDVPANAELTEVQRSAHAGELRAAMRGYIEWLMPQTDRLSDELAEMFYAYRARAQECFRDNPVHGRTVEAVAQIMIGLTMMNRYFASIGIYSPEESAAVTEECWQIVTENSRAQAESSREEKPSRMFVSALRELLTSKAATVVDIAPGAGKVIPDKNMIGYVDVQNYYFLGDSAYGAVVRFYREQDRAFPVKRAALYRELRSEGYVVDFDEGKSTKGKRTPDGKLQRLLWIPRRCLDGDKPFKPVQEKMEFIPVSDEEIPTEFGGNT